MNSATDVARFLVQKYIDIKKPITNMKLQKLLYFAWVEYYKVSESYLFNDRISAWKFGPVVADVYREYRIFAARPITFTKEPGNILDDDVRSFLSHFAEEYVDVSASELVSRTHREGTPWEVAYVEGEDRQIPFKTIVDVECRR